MWGAHVFEDALSLRCEIYSLVNGYKIEKIGTKIGFKKTAFSDIMRGMAKRRNGDWIASCARNDGGREFLLGYPDAVVCTVTGE